VEKISDEESAATSVSRHSAVSAEDRRVAEAALHRDIGGILPKLRRYARSLTRNAADADDLVQECMARALAKLHLWQAGTDLRAWLFRILHNQYVSQVRRTARKSPTVDWSKCAPALASAPEQIEYLEFRELERAIMSLPQQQRTAVLRISLTPGNYYEVAAACDVPVGTIRSRLARGRRALRELTGVTALRDPISERREAFATTSAGAKLTNLACDPLIVR